MRLAFVDTSALIALYDRRDTHHQHVRACLEKWDGELVTTNAVIGETYTFLRYSGHGALAQRILREAPPFAVEPFNASEEADARNILLQYHDQLFSYVDAISFAFMRVRAIQSAIAFDAHFLIAGFQLVGYGTIWS